MLIYEYFEDFNKGLINKKTKKNDLRKILKSNYLEFPKEEFYNKRDSFRSIGIMVMYDDNDYLQSIEINTIPLYLSFKNFNLFTFYEEIVKELRNKKIDFVTESEGIHLEKKNINIYLPEMNYDENKDQVSNELCKVVSFNFELQKLNGSISFERLSSHHIPSKVTYENSNISADNGPAIRMNYDHEKYFSCHGKSRKTLKYLEKQKQLVQNGKVMDAIQNDEDDIIGKTITTYSRAIKEMKDYARNLSPSDFIIK